MSDTYHLLIKTEHIIPRYKYDAKADKVVEITTERETNRKNTSSALWNDTHYYGARTTHSLVSPSTPVKAVLRQGFQT
jgi:hypothetical protein